MRKWLHKHGDLDFGDTHELLNIAFNHLGGSGVQVPEKTELGDQKGDRVQGMESQTWAGKEGSVSQFAVSPMQQEDAHMTPANSSIAARSAMETIPNGNALTVSKHWRSRGLDDQWDGKWPRYIQFVFGKSEVGCTPSATYTEVASPVPGVLTSDYQYQDITRTLLKYPHLFKIVTPIHADCLHWQSRSLGYFQF